MALTFSIDVQGAQAALVALDRFAEVDRAALLNGLGGLLESQHRRRIESEHTTPGGAAFTPNQRGTTPLFETGRHLRDAFYYVVADPEVRVSNNFIGAGLLHSGGVVTPKNAKALHFSLGGNREVFAKRVNIPPRPFMGISADNQTEIMKAVEDFLAAGAGGGA